jgi:hypothetical protein
MGMRISWGLWDTEYNDIVALFEAQNLLEGYRDQLYRRWFDQQTIPISDDVLPDDDETALIEYKANREVLLGLGYERWRADQINAAYPRYITKRYELWNSVPPNPERLVMHFDT